MIVVVKRSSSGLLCTGQGGCSVLQVCEVYWGKRKGRLCLILELIAEEKEARPKVKKFEAHIDFDCREK